MSVTDRVKELAAVMREVGVVRAEIDGDRIKLELGSEVVKYSESIPKTDDEIIREGKLNAEEADRMLFAASEGYFGEVSE